MGEMKTVFEVQLNAMGELAKFDITGELDHLEEARYLAYQSGLDGDEKTSFLQERRLSEWYEEGFNDRVTDHAIGMMEAGLKDSGFTVNAECGNTYVGEIVDAGNKWSVIQAVIQDGVGSLVRHERNDLNSVLSGLINVGQLVKVSYPVPGMGIVEAVRPLE